MRNVLIVDDETPIREWIDAHIRDYPGIGKTFTSRNGEEAIRILNTTGIDIVFTDITMPKLNGIELLTYIKKCAPDIDVVIMSVHNEFEYARAALKQGAFEYILKNEITRDGIFQILDKIRAHRDIKEIKKGSDEESLVQIIRSKYLQRLLINGEFKADMEELKENRINIDDSLLFAVAMPADPDKAARLQLHKNINLSNVTFFLYAKNKMLFIANILKEDNAYVKQLADNIKGIVDENIGYSRIHRGTSGFLDAAREAIAMREYLFYSPDDISDFSVRSKSEEKKLKIEMETIQNQIVETYKMRRREKAIMQFKAFIDFIEKTRLDDVDFVKNYIAITAHRIYNNSKAMNIDMKSFENSILFCRNVNEVRVLLEEFYSKMETGDQYSDSITNAIEFIESNYMKQISLADVAEKVFLNDEYFSRLFKKEVGMNFTDYLTDIRMKEAKRLITTTDIKISAVAEMVGVPNNKYFSLLFKKYFDTPPSQMREER